MKKDKGISLISLVVTVFILLLLASTIIISTRDSYSVIKVQNFMSKLKIIQAKVDNLAENENYYPPQRLRLSDSNTHYTKFSKIFTNLKLEGNLSDEENLNDYYCFEPSDLETELGLKDVNMTVIINFKTRNVIAEKGITLDGVTYYREYDFESGEQIIDNSLIVAFYDSKEGNLIFKKRVTPGSKVNYSIPTKEDDDTTAYSFNGWKKVSDDSTFDANTEVNEDMKVYATWNTVSKLHPTTNVADGTVTFSTNYGTIDVIWLDVSNNVITQPNSPSPYLAGMTKVTWTEGADHSATEDETANANWYSYAAGTGTTDNRSSRWANAKNSDGSYFVWIPRYAYRITYYNDQADSGDDTKITGYYDGYGQWKSADGKLRLALDEGVETVNYNGKKYIVHPAFTNDSDTVGSKMPFDLGGWDSELEGFWFAKYEMSRNNATDVSSGSGTTFVSKPGIQSARSINIGDMYNYSLAFDNGKSSHMMKNSEWGAVAYLTQSQYGRNGNEIDINNSSSYITGNGGGSTNAGQTSGTVNAYNSAIGTKASSTGNVYGIYDLSGGAWEFIAAFNNTDTKNYESKYGSAFASTSRTSDKYATKYYNETSSLNGNAITYTYGKIGDATKEINKGGLQATTGTTNYSNWFSDYFGFVCSEGPFFGRGGGCKAEALGGIFYSNIYNGLNGDYKRFPCSLMPIGEK